jgi:hypothetical protein
MVFILDEGSAFDAPLSKVWELAQTEGKHSHPSQLNTKMSMQGEHPILDFDSKTPDGKLMHHTIRITNIPPVGFILEYTGGAMKGTKLVQYYIPKGSVTGVTVVGDAVSSMPVPEQQLRGMVLQGLATAFNEDVENLKKL